ncbi:MAG: hypothetical protein HY662_01730 [Chloroflexi bacterium]|nr:hypothetical protein [Chloroflexota bacterium]
MRVSSKAVLAYSIIALVGVLAIGLMSLSRARVPKDVLDTYTYDAVAEKWVRSAFSTPVPTGTDGRPQRPASHTIEIRLDGDNPIKEIIIQETLVINPGDVSGNPLFEIIGHDTGGSGKINIGELTIKEVDAERLKIDADVVATNIQRVAAQDNELDLDLDAVNVVRTGRGGVSSFFLGVSRRETLTKFSTLPDEFTGERNRGLTADEAGLRVDRIRIIGPSSNSTAFVERLTFMQSSVFGEIRVRDVAIQELILKDIFLDDSF